MALYSSNDDITRLDPRQEPVTISAFPYYCQLKTVEQVRSFELLRLAFFALKLRKLERSYKNIEKLPQSEYEFSCKLLRYAIFQQILALISLDAREQAFQLLNACRV